MQTIFLSVWISSINHMDSFSIINQKNPGWKYILGLNKIPDDFPQVKSGYRKYPVVLFSKGSLEIFERQIDFKSNIIDSSDNLKYSNLKNLNFEIDYSSIKIEWYLHRKPFLKAFNISWIKLSISNSNLFDHILISADGTGIGMNQLRKINEEIFEAIKMRSGE